MAKTRSTMLNLGTVAPAFDLPNTNRSIDKEQVTLGQFSSAPALLIAFICNHCPYVIHICDEFSAFANEYTPKGLQVIAINSNDISTHPADGPEKMADVASEHNYTFPYLYDQTQDVAKAYTAACTPDFFLFDTARKLVYRGQFDGSRPGNNQPINGADMCDAVDALLAGRPVAKEQVPSIGCNIKWKAGQEPDYFNT